MFFTPFLKLFFNRKRSFSISLHPLIATPAFPGANVVDGQVETLAINRLFHRNTFDHHHQLGPTHTEGVLFLIVAGSLEATGLQTLVVDHQTATFPVKDLNRVPGAINEDKDFTTQWVATHLGTDHTGQSIKTLAHVGRTGKQVILQVAGQGKHYR